MQASKYSFVSIKNGGIPGLEFSPKFTFTKIKVKVNITSGAKLHILSTMTNNFHKKMQSGRTIYRFSHALQ